MENIYNRIEINDKRIINLDIDVAGLGCVKINEGFLDDSGDIDKSYMMIRTDDYGFTAFTMDDTESLSFTFDKNHPLYIPLLNLLNGDEELIIDDDFTRENNKKYMQIVNNKDGSIDLYFFNKLDKCSVMDQFSVSVKNIMFDLRSKIDEQGKDTKKRLFKFFIDASAALDNKKVESGADVDEEVTDGMNSDDYHQITIDEYCSENLDTETQSTKAKVKVNEFLAIKK